MKWVSNAILGDEGRALPSYRSTAVDLCGTKAVERRMRLIAYTDSGSEIDTVPGEVNSAPSAAQRCH